MKSYDVLQQFVLGAANGLMTWVCISAYVFVFVFSSLYHLRVDFNLKGKNKKQTKTNWWKLKIPESCSEREVDETATSVVSVQSGDAGWLDGSTIVAPDPGSGVSVGVHVVEQLGWGLPSSLHVLLLELRHHHRLVESVVVELMLLRNGACKRRCVYESLKLRN